eukprot:Sspe_Gene.2116::Locus_700_Transcript_1_1_Confidence_1.000_Length_512::g.2116::m.2116
MSSSDWSLFSYRNRAVLPDSFLDSVTKFRHNMGSWFLNGRSQGFGTFPAIQADARIPAMVLVHNHLWNTINLGKMHEDIMATTIDKRHGWENFQSMPREDQARIRNYVRSEWFYDFLLSPEDKYSPEAFAALPMNQKY